MDAVSNDATNQLSLQMTERQQASVERSVRNFNATLEEIPTNSDLGKDDFLRLLVTQLQYQDPTKPMEDKEFIAQMAQFSSLEQMNNMANEFSSLTNLFQSGQALGLLNREVDIAIGEQVISGVVSEVSSGPQPKIKVDGVEYDYADVRRVR